MLVEIYLLFQIIVFILFFIAFFTKQEVLWAITIVLTGVLMFSSWTIETYTYAYNETLGAYVPYMELRPTPYMAGINIMLFGLALVFCLYDIFDKYGRRLKSE